MRPEFLPILNTVVMQGGISIDWSFLDLFTTDDDAPLTNPSPMAPGPGSWVPTNTNNALAKSGGLLTIVGTTAAGGDGIIAADGLSRVDGLTVMLSFYAFVDGIFYPQIAQGSSLAITGLGVTPSTVLNTRYSPVIEADTSPTATGDAYAIMVFSAGHAIFRYRSSTWKLVFVERASNAATLYPQVNNATAPSANYSLSGFGGAVLPFTRTSLVTDSKDNANADDTITHTANGVIEATHQFQAGETYEISFRRTDDNNRWILRVVHDTDTATLVKVETGGETVVATNATKNFTTSGPTWFHIRVTGDTIIAGFDGASTDGTLFEYALASFNNTATGAKVNLASTYFYSYAESVPSSVTAYLNTMLSTINP